MVWSLNDDEYLSGRDNAWFRMGDRTNRMVITAVLFFDEPVTYDELKERFEDRLTRFDRFRQRLVEPWHGLRPKWEEDPLFDIDDHISHVALPEPQSEEEFQEFVGDVMDDNLDPDRPLWHAWLVEGGGSDGGNALVVRIHHVLADGFALLYVLFGLADDPASVELPVGELPPLPGEEGENNRRGSDKKKRGRRGGFDLVSAGENLLQGAKAARAAYDSFPLSRESNTPLRGKLATSKRVSWTDTFDLDDVKSAAHEYDGTVNDLLMAATAGAFRRYIEEEGFDVPDGLELRASMPVNLRPLEERDEQLGNYFGLGFLDLPVGVDDPEERVRLIQERTGVLKQGTEARMMYSVLDTVGSMPDIVQDVAALTFRGRVTATVSNVPGPIENLEFAGKEVNDIIFWAPTTEDIGIGLSIFSYGGEVRIGIATDKNVVPEPDLLADAFKNEIYELFEATGVETDTGG